ncbi:DUF1156 domain-containing protein [Hymenobacter aquaticus]|uniref:DUF1156 domain-containing protein n=1 Tax=Hymenobacter aquaticus TaxID=1867101 RepID=A0A4Z0PZG9_9BACT|nr:anti-phage-associated DUF1156 domain-containing protein [Hymenobacter aquaticus]TGE21862.1 DUF1156 domain-containing protein [Hymenobacter aquaticus]
MEVAATEKLEVRATAQPGGVVPGALANTPALIERLMPVQKLSAEAYKEQMAVQGKTLTALGSYWKGRKPLILNRACLLGCLLPATDQPARDLAILEMLLGMDDESLAGRQKRAVSPKEILTLVPLNRLEDYFEVRPAGALPVAAPVSALLLELNGLRVNWRADVTAPERRRLEAEALVLRGQPYRERVSAALRPEEVAPELLQLHIWKEVNSHLGTQASSLPELVEQLGIMRFGHRPRVADTFSGSGQIPFEAARLGCDVYASDLNPIACMLTWGAFNIVGGTASQREALRESQQALVKGVKAEVDRLEVESDGQGWRAKVFLYCLEARCPQSGWLVPLLPKLIVSKGFKVVAELVPDPENKRYNIELRQQATVAMLAAADRGTVRTDGNSREPYLYHVVDGKEYRTKISTLRGDYRRPDGSTGNRLRQWEKSDFQPRPDDLYQERLYAVQWVRPRQGDEPERSEFRAVTADDLAREQKVARYVAEHLADWQEKGWIPDMRIEPGDKTIEPIRTRGWMYWHQLFNARQLLVAGFTNSMSDAFGKFALTRMLNKNSRLSRWDIGVGGGGATQGVFDTQAMNTLYNYGTRGTDALSDSFEPSFKQFSILSETKISSHAANEINTPIDIFLTDPPYGDAVKYEEILEFFIAWLRKSPPPEFADWVWDSRRALAIKGEDEAFRRSMVSAYARMATCMPANGLQVVMFTHQSSTIWADMANIVWAAGLQATAAWYVVTETDSALRAGSYVKGTVLLVLRKREENLRITRDDLAYEIQDEVEEQVRQLTGLNQQVMGRQRAENVFEDADIQMAGYAAALRVLTRYSVIDGRDMTTEAARPRVRNQETFVDSLIKFAVDTANQCLVPQGISAGHWKQLNGAERFYLKMLDLEDRDVKTLDNYQNFAKAFKVRDYQVLLASLKANDARLRSASEMGRAEMSEGAELYGTVLRAVLYALMQLERDEDGAIVQAQLTHNIPTYYADLTQRELAIELAGYLARHLARRRPEEAKAARILRELLTHQQLG